MAKPKDDVLDGRRKGRPKSITRQVRFSVEQLKLVEARADEMKLPVSTFMRLATLSAAGLAQEEITRLRKIADSLEHIAEVQG